METPVPPQTAGSIGDAETEGMCEQSFATSVEGGGLFLVSQEDTAVVSDTSATANLVCLSWLARRNRILGRREIPRVTTYPSQARFRFGDGRLGEVRHAADIPVGIARSRRMLTASLLEADIPALLREGAAEELGGQLGFLRGSLNLRRQGALYPERGRFS